ncbi:DUF3592 domain-containing protein [Emticicia sp. BO119]|uniref:DUF3592 domain-containing protein n=1 Tax=Emticicia sp. BO119 TaxID=2757768 RepID=UPI0015F0EE9A|nr:DUF3592 domain-containing protein [Emticicia sp. BO119]MBA4853103.1 DUF3592 domain-containing protein [Emticicia sp. BO119]
MRLIQKPQSFYSRNSAHIILGAGMLLLISAVFIYGSQYIFIKKAHKTVGIVTGFSLPKGKTLKRPVIEYYTSDQQKHVYYHSEGTNPPKYHKGEKVKIYYNPLNPEDASLGYSFIPIIILCIFGLVFTGIGIVMNR